MANSPHASRRLSSSTQELCRRFREEWASGARPSIAAYLKQVAESERESLFAVLVEADWSFRLDLGEVPRLEDYSAQLLAAGCELPEDLSQLQRLEQPPSLTETNSISKGSFESTDASVVGAVDRQRLELTEPFRPLPMPQRVGRYQFQDLLGRGGYGEVWQAYDPDLDRLVAVKVLRNDRMTASINDLLAEARKIAQCRHPSILRVLDVGRDAGHLYVVTELMPGGSLAGHLAEYRGQPWRAADLVARVAEGLHYAHLRGIVHRDIKPQNILLDQEGLPHVADFGLAVTEEEQLVEMASKCGTFAYMSPEQARGHSHHADVRSDVYSLGVVLYQLLTQRTPFVAHTPDQWTEQILHREPRPPRTVDEGIPAELERICLKCLAKKPADRYTTARDVAQDLTRAASVGQSGPKRLRRNKLAMMGVVLGLAVCMAAVAYVIGQGEVPHLSSHQASKPPMPPTIPTTSPASPLAAATGADETEPTIAKPLEDPFKIEMAEFDLVPPKPNEWTLGLQRTPKVLWWPKNRQGCSFEFDDQERSLSVMCNNIGMIELGRTDRPVLNLQTRLTQAGWEGGLGLFFGFQEDSKRGPAFRRFQAVTLERQSERGLAKLLVYRHVFVLEETGRIVFQEHVPITKSKPLPDDSALLELGVLIDQVSVRYGIAEAEAAPNGVLADLQVSDFQGKYGLFVNRSSAVFSNVRVLLPP